MAVAAALAGTLALAQGGPPPTPEAPAEQPRVLQPQGDYLFRVFPAIDTLAADGQSSTTIVAFLADMEGNPFDGEQVRFILRSGIGVLETPGLGADVSPEEASDFESTQDTEFGTTETGTTEGDFESAIAVDGINIGNGIYVARFRASTVPGRVTVGAVWLSAPAAPLPEATADLNLVTADSLTVRVDDDVLLADGEDQATIIAYVLDGLNRPVSNADVTFRVVRGPGSLEFVGGAGGRYVATYTAGTAPGEAVIEVALPTISRPIRQRVTVTAVEAVELTGRAFPTRVARLPANGDVRTINTSTILIAVRDGDGDLVRGLAAEDLQAQVVSGPGTVSEAQEILLNTGEGSGVYYFTFTASETNGRSIVRVTNLASPGNPAVEVEVETVPQLRPNIAERLEIETYADDPFYADGQSPALIVLMAMDSEGDAISGLDPEFLITEGRGEIDVSVEEIDNLAGAEGTGIYVTTFTAGQASTNTASRVRSIVTNLDGSVVTGEAVVASTPLGTPRLVVFPESIPANRPSRAVIDIFDFDAEALETDGPRYRVEILTGPGSIVQEADNSGSGADLIADDNVHSAMYESETTAVDQEVRFRVTDVAPAGYPTAQARLRLGLATRLDAVAFPVLVRRGEMIQVTAFARDEFGLPAVGHDLVLTVVDGSGTVLMQGRMFDDGGEVEGFTDAYANDGVYVGAFRASAIAAGTVILRVTDTTPSTQPTVDIQVEVR